MSKQRGLGRGFDALIPTEVGSDAAALVQPTGQQSIILVDPASIAANPHQPRQYFDETDLAGLASSIKEHGLLHPPVVSQSANGSYELVAGERRVRASKLAGLNTIPVIVRSFEEQQKLELALLENVQRSQLSPLETAAAYRKLIDEFNLTLEQLGERMGQAKSTVSNLMRLMQLPAAAQHALQHGKISEAHGRALLALDDPDKQTELLDRILQDKWTVRQAEAFVQDQKRQAHKSAKASGTAPAASAQTARLVSELSGRLGAKVKMQEKAKGGRLVIDYGSKADLQRIAEIILKDSDAV